MNEPTATSKKPIQKWVQEQLDKIDWKSDKPIRFNSTVNIESSPYSQNGKKLVNNTEFIAVTDVVTDDDGNEVSIRFKADFDSILVSEQETRGHTHPDYGKTPQHRKSRADNIVMSNGYIEVIPKGNKNKITFLLTTNQNGSNPSRKKNATALFTVDDSVAKAKTDFSQAKLIDKARALVLTLEGNYTRLLEVAKTIQREPINKIPIDTTASEEQLLLQLRAVAEQTPQLVISSISEEKAQVDVLVHKALDLGIVEFTGNGYKFSGTGTLIKGFRGMQNPDVAFKQLITFLGTDEGHVHMLNITKLVTEFVNKEQTV